jgi:hypothetical protein
MSACRCRRPRGGAGQGRCLARRHAGQAAGERHPERPCRTRCRTAGRRLAARQPDRNSGRPRRLRRNEPVAAGAGRTVGRGGWLALVAPPWLPHAPAWAAAGLALERLVVVQGRPAGRLVLRTVAGLRRFCRRAGLAGSRHRCAKPCAGCRWRQKGGRFCLFVAADWRKRRRLRRRRCACFWRPASEACRCVFSSGAADRRRRCSICPIPRPGRLPRAVAGPALSLLPLEALPLRQSPSAVVSRGRVLVCDRGGGEAGVCAGQKLSTALGLQPGLAVFERDAGRERQALESLACWAGRFTPTISLAPPAGCCSKSAACLRLFGGAEAIVEAVLAGCAGQGYSVRWAARRRRSAHAGWRRPQPHRSSPKRPAMQAALAALPAPCPAGRAR